MAVGMAAHYREFSMTWKSSSCFVQVSSISSQLSAHIVILLFILDARKKTAKKPSNPAGLKIDLEANLLSLRDREFEDRDKEVHPEVVTT